MLPNQTVLVLKIPQIPQAVSEGTNEDYRENNAPQPSCSGVENILKIPQKQKRERRKCRKGKAKQSHVYGPEESVKPKIINIRGTCGGDFKDHVKARNGKEWIECLCKTWYHVECQTVLDLKYFLYSECQISD
ncbi:unnamed protein product [Parnassius apollo]|uniref:(apollo) hypothetical protein n=1 Tax=Parnassius apollo TaxID=110799 RepID=A0A8S3W3B8_PARAO|nr:unnamed protein product [Parnassius apollo]